MSLYCEVSFDQSLLTQKIHTLVVLGEIWQLYSVFSSCLDYILFQPPSVFTLLGPLYVDAGYMDAESLVASQAAYQVDLVGPTARDHRWQSREQKRYALRDFSIDWEREQALCPQGQISSSWTPTRTRNQDVIKPRSR